MESSKIAADFKNIRSRNYHKIWEPFMRKYQCDYICELGVYKGDNFLEMIKHGPKLAVAIDAWIDDGVESRNDSHYSQEQLNNQYEHFKAQVKEFSFVKTIRDYTVNASIRFPDNYFDFVYIDADHSIDGSWTDINSWYPKVKPGKFLVGHDYRKRFGVFESVNRFTTERHLDLLFLAPSTWAVVKK